MWIYLKKDGVLFDCERDGMFISKEIPEDLKCDGDYTVRASLGEDEAEVVAEFNREQLEVFIETFSSHLKRKVPLMVFDQDNLLAAAMQSYMKGAAPKEEPVMNMDVDLE